jgi:hypothetical protein
MGLQYRKKTTLWRSRKPGRDGRAGNEVWLNWKIPTRRQPLPVSLSARIGPLVFNTDRGWASARTPIKGLTWQDRD